jgi:ribosomal protein S18 acetylase RimI-like enzyme
MSAVGIMPAAIGIAMMLAARTMCTESRTGQNTRGAIFLQALMVKELELLYLAVAPTVEPRRGWDSAMLLEAMVLG